MSRSTVDKRDIYYRLCKSEGYRARSAYKLLHIDEEFDIFTGVKTAVDLCAAPGSWSQVLSRKLKPDKEGINSKIISIDLQPMAPLPNVTTLRGDITLPSTLSLLLSHMATGDNEGTPQKAQLVVCDGAPEITGVHDLDGYLHGQLLLAALTLSLPLLAPQGTLILKIFTSPLDPKGEILKSQFGQFFEGPSDSLEEDEEVDMDSEEWEETCKAGKCQIKGYDRFGRRGGVWVVKPRSSRAGSAEAFLVCRNFAPSALPVSFELNDLDESLPLSLSSFKHSNPVTTNGESTGVSWNKIRGYAIGDLDAK